MAEQALTIVENQRLVVWRVGMTLTKRHLRVPWGELWRGGATEAGQEVWVKADQAFDLLMHHGSISYFEAISPGLHHFVLTVLDSDDVAS